MEVPWQGLLMVQWEGAVVPRDQNRPYSSDCNMWKQLSKMQWNVQRRHIGLVDRLHRSHIGREGRLRRSHVRREGRRVRMGTQVRVTSSVTIRIRRRLLSRTPMRSQWTIRRISMQSIRRIRMRTTRWIPTRTIRQTNNHTNSRTSR